MPAKGLVAEIRQTVHTADAFTRIERERDQAQKEQREVRRKKLEADREIREKRESIRQEIGALFSEPNHQRRGKVLESVLNRLFASFGILIREAFTVQGTDGEGTVAQIDGAIGLDNDIYLVEMKWLKDKVGPGDVAQHINRVMFREGARGIFISATDFTSTAQNALCQSLSHRVQVGIQLQEIIYTLEKKADLTHVLREKVQAAILDKNPFHFITLT